ncbi:MAG: MBL fold metallo-hydrolase [Proteobacteria bacterium]|nr:MBL fold metallo-hydrolase [Pseudomonadota bacterium]
MKIKFYGHSAFMITTDTGVRIITDPYKSGAFGGTLSYGKITDKADIVLASHDHDDHNYTKDIKGNFVHIKTAGAYDVNGLKIRAIPSHHDTSKGKERGNNLIFVIDADGLTIMHAGDLGHTLGKEAVEEIGKIDILLIPVGGFYTIDAREATKVMKDLKPAITIPMHFKTDKCNFPISNVQGFIGDKKDVKRVKASEIEIKKELLPKEREIIVLEPAL